MVKDAEIASPWIVGLGGLISQISQAWEINVELASHQ